MCKYPLRGYFAEAVNASGKRSIVFARAGSYKGPKPEWASELLIDCGQCLPCRLEKSRQWALRMTCEAKMHDASVFLTLTYAPKHLPEDRSLHPEHVTLFLKRLRKSIPCKIRYYLCGEYGSQFSRPHYHLIIFGYHFPDRELFNSEKKYYTSPLISSKWTFGYHILTDFSFDTAAYVARYCLKKVTGEPAEEHYNITDVETGRVTTLHPEYARMSRRKGIGYGFYENFFGDLFPSDSMSHNGKLIRPPKIFLKWLERDNELLARSIKKIRELYSKPRELDVLSDLEVDNYLKTGILPLTAKDRAFALTESKFKQTNRSYEKQ